MLQSCAEISTAMLPPDLRHPFPWTAEGTERDCLGPGCELKRSIAYPLPGTSQRGPTLLLIKYERFSSERLGS